jgi:pyrroline-5-carboxylate reductase
MIGIVGLGHLGRAIAQGLLRGLPANKLLLAPWKPDVAEFARSAGCLVGHDLQDVADRSDVVLISVRSDQILPVLKQIQWREDQLLVSTCAGVAFAELRLAVKGAEVIRTLPLLTASFGASPTAMYPPSARGKKALSPLGPVFAFDEEAQFDSANCTAVLFTIGHALVGWTSDWAVKRGVEPRIAQDYAAAMLEAAGRALTQDRRPVSHERLSELATPNGLAEAALVTLKNGGVPGLMDLAYDAAAKAAAAYSKAQ